MCLTGVDKNNAPVTCESYKLDLIQQISGVDGTIERCSETELSVSSVDLYDWDTYDVPSNSNICVWLETLEKRARNMLLKSSKGNRDNIMYNPGIINDLSRLCRLLPMWSAVAMTIFHAEDKTASSTHVECYFKNVKQSLDDAIPCSVDVFVQRNIEMNNGAMKIASVKHIQLNSQMPLREPDTNASISSAVITEIGYDSVITNESNCDDVAMIDISDIDDRNNIGEFSSSASNVIDLVNSNSPIRNLMNVSSEVEDIPLNESDVTNTNGNINDAEANQSNDITIFDDISTDSLIGNNESYGELNQQASNQIMNIEAFSLPPDLREYHSSNPAESMNETEKWSKKKPSKKSFYLQPRPHFIQLPHIDSKKIKIGIVQNFRKKHITTKVDKLKIITASTAGIDSIIQILAAAYAYYATYRTSRSATLSTKIHDIALGVSTK